MLLDTTDLERVLLALEDGPLTLSELIAKTHLPADRARSIIGELEHRKRVALHPSPLSPWKQTWSIAK